MPSQFEQYRVDERTEFSANFWNSIFGNVDARIAAIENLRQELDAAVENLNQVALARINDILAPAIIAIQKTQSLGFLIATSTTPQTLATSGVFTFTCTGDTAATFTPSPFVAIQRTANYTDYAIARTSSYDRLTGRFICQIMATFGAIDGTKSFSDWQIQGSPGVVVAEQKLLDDTRAARDTAVQKAADTVTTFTNGVAAVNAAVTTATKTATDAAAAATKTATDAATAAAAAQTAINTSVNNAGTSASAAAASATTATTQAGIATTKAAEVTSQLAAIAGGPVASINGRTGIVFTDPVEAMGGALPTLDLHLTQHDGLPLGLFTRASTAYRRRESGVLAVSAAGVPRIDHDAAGTNLGMLFEETRTNVFLNSGAPATQSIALTAGTYTLSLAGAGSAALSGGPTGTATAAAPVTFTLGASTTVTVTIAGGPTSVQLEAGAFATSYIPTTTSSAARAADGLVVPVSDWINPAEGTLYVEAITPGSGFVTLAALGSSANGQLFIERLNSGPAGGIRVMIQANGYFPTLVVGTPAAGSRLRLAVAYKTGELAASLNGGVVSTAPITSFPDLSLNPLVIGSNSNGTTATAPQWGSTVSRVLYVPRRLDNPILQRMTA